MRYRVGSLIVDADRLAVFEAGRALNVAPKVVEVLVVLCEQAGCFVSKEMLRERLWPSGNTDDSVLWQKVYLARKTLAKYLGPGTIETLARRGYRLTVPVGHEPLPVEIVPVVRRRRVWGLGAISCAAVLLVLVGAGMWSRTLVAPAVALDPPTLRAYNLGRYFLSQRTSDSLTKAEREFEVVASSSDGSIAALGYAGLADAHAALSAMRRGRGRDIEVLAARRAAEAALRRDPRSGEAEAALGTALTTRDRYDARGGRIREDAAARAAFATAVAERPDFATGHLRYGEYLLWRGETRAAVAQLQRSIDLDPSSAISNLMLAQAIYALGDTRAAVSYATRALAFGTSDQEDALTTLGLAYQHQHRLSAALQAFHAMARYSPQLAQTLIARARAE